MKSKSIFLPIFLILSISVIGQNVINYFDGNTLFSTVKKYVSLGEHRTGTPTDLATSEWIGKELKSVGYGVKYLEFPIRQFFPQKVFLAAGKDTIQAFPLWWVNEKINRGVTGMLVDAGKIKTVGANSIALIHLPLKQAKINPKTYIDSLVNLGVTGIVAITDNESGEIEAYIVYVLFVLLTWLKIRPDKEYRKPTETTSERVTPKPSMSLLSNPPKKSKRQF